MITNTIGLQAGIHRFLASVFAVAGLSAMAPSAFAVPLKATGNPVVTGTGATMKARWSNVGQTANGNSVDLLLEVVSYTGQAKWVMVTENDDFKFQFTGGTMGEQRTATLRWSFFIGGTNNPATVSSLGFTIDDLDDGIRHESLSTTDAYDYTVNNPTKVVHSKVGGLITAAGGGGVEYNSGDPKAAVKLLFADKSTFLITYKTRFDGIDLSAYHHDGNGDFIFDTPPVNLYYTYNLTNNEQYDKPVDFTNTLPEGLLFDPDYKVLTGQLTWGSFVFSNGFRTISATNMVLRPGANTLKLRTLETSKKGAVANSATLNPRHPQMQPIVKTASITLP